MSIQDIRVLLVDDETSFRKPLVISLLRQFEQHVRPFELCVDEAASGRDALQLLESQGRYDVALIDQVLEGEIDGLELLHEIKTRYPEIQVIVFTGWPDKMQEEGVKVLHAGAYRYFAKPFNLEELALTIQFAAEESRTQLERRYMAALVKVGQGLTQTTHQNEQLKLAWDFVREQLDVKSFFISLSTPDQRRISFPIFFDEGREQVVKDRTLGKSRRNWGLAGYVVRTGEEILWATPDGLEQFRKNQKVFPILIGVPSSSGVCLPLRMGEQILGVISAQSSQTHVFTPVLQNALRALSSQLSVALENSRLFRETEQKSRDLEHHANTLATMQELVLTINSSLELDEILTKTCKSAVEFFQADHSGLVLFDSDYEKGTVVAEYPNLNARGRIIPLRGIPAEERLIKTRKPLIVPDVRSYEALGIVRETLSDLNVQSVLIVPVIGKGGVIGSFSLDAIEHIRLFTKEEISLCKTFADQVAVAIENARLYSQLNETKEKLAAMIENSFDAVIAIDMDTRITVFNQRAEEMLGWKSEEMIGQTVARLHVDVENAIRIFEVIEKEGSVTGYSVELKHRDGTRIPALLSARLIRDSRSQPLFQVGFMHDLREVQHREQLLTALDEASRHIRAEKEPIKLLHEVVRLAAQLVGASVGGICLNHPQLGELEIAATYGLSTELISRRLDNTEGLVGWVARTGKLQVIESYSEIPEQDAALRAQGICAMVGIPLKRAGTVEAVLFVADTTSSRRFSGNDLEILERFAAQASIVLQTSKLMSQELRMLSQLAVLHKISDYIQDMKDLDKILHVVLTGVTAGYGLGFNRAALFLLDQSQNNLTGRMGIGYLEEQEAKEDWLRHHQLGFEDFGRYLELLEEGALQPTPVGLGVKDLSFPLSTEDQDALERAILERNCIRLKPDDLNILPTAFIEAFKPTMPLVVVPLVVRDRAIGLLVADNKFTQSPITDEDVESLMTFSNTAAIAIDNAQLFRETQEGLARLSSVYEASNQIVSTLEPDKALYFIVEKACQTMGGWRARIFLIDEAGHPQRLVDYGFKKVLDTTYSIRPGGISMKVMKTGRPVFIVNIPLEKDGVVNPKLIEDGVMATACLPFALKEKPLGVMWVHYQEPRHFSDAEKETLRLYTNQAVIAYDNARRMRELEHMRKAIEAMAGALEPTQVLQQIIQGACDVVQADSSAIWSYDTVRNQFTPEEYVAFRIPPEKLERFRGKEPRKGGIADTILSRNWVGVADITDRRHSFIDSSTIDLLSSINAKSFQGVALKIGDEKLGVLYVNYSHMQSFDKEDRRILETFAHHASLALKKARLLKQLSKARDAAKAVSKLSVSEELTHTLNSIVSGTQEVLGCDVVTLYIYDQDRDEFGFPPSMVGVKRPENVLTLNYVARESVPYKVINLDSPYEAEDSVSDPLIGSPFTSREDIKSTIAVPLIAKSKKVGLLFVNYRSRHRFTVDELTNIELYANQAAVAIRNAQLFQAEQQHAKTLEAIQSTSAAVSAVLELNVLLPMISEKASEIFNAPATSLMLWDESKENLVIKAAFGLSEQYKQNQRIHYKIVDKLVSNMGLEPQVFDIFHKPIGDPKLVEKEGLYSVLVAPLTIAEELIGILNIYSKNKSRLFEEKEKELAKVFANHASLALGNARMMEQIRNARDAAKIVAQVTVLEELNTTLVSIAKGTQKALSCDVVTLYCYDPEHDVFAFPPTMIGVKEENMVLKLGRVTEGSVVRKILALPEPHIAKDSSTDQIMRGSFVSRENIKSSIGIPLQVGELKIGVMFVNFRSPHRFTADEITNIELFSNQAAVAIRNAQLYEQMQERAEALQALNHAGQAITGTLELNKILNSIVEQAWHLVGRFGDHQAQSSYIALIEGNKLKLTAVYPQEMRSILEKTIGEIDLSRERKGITGRTVELRRSNRVVDVALDPDYIGHDSLTHSELAVPIILGKDVFGVINVEHSKINAFDAMDQQALEALASQAAIAIQNARQYTELMQIKGLIGARTALAWTGMMGSTWRHGIEKHAITIREQIQLSRNEISYSTKAKSLSNRLDMIERLANKILEKPITPPLSAEEGVELIHMNDLIRERIDKLWSHEPYKKVSKRLDLDLSDTKTVRASPEWLRRALDILIDNAVDATLELAEKQIIIGTRQREHFVEISIRDNGIGVPIDLQEKLFKEPIKKPEGAKGQGMGLLFALTIAQTYGGEIWIGETGQSGTTMILSLPLEI